MTKAIDVMVRHFDELTNKEAVLLAYIYEYGPCSQSEMATDLTMNRGGISDYMGRLMDKDLISRSKDLQGANGNQFRYLYEYDGKQ